MNDRFWKRGFVVFMPVLLSTVYCAVPLHCPAESTVAIIADTKELTGVTDLLTAALSTNSRLVVLERTDVDRVLSEHNRSVSNQDDLSIGAILGADGLLFVKTLRTDAGSVLSSRLVAVGPGVCIADVITPWPTEDLLMASDHIISRLTPMLPKLDVTSGEAIQISLLTLRSSMDTHQSRALDMELTHRLAHRLMQEKEIFVLERWRMDALDQEKTLDRDDGESYWQGTHLLDGKVSEQNGAVDLTLSLHFPDGKEVSVTGNGNRENLDTLIESIAAALLSHTGDQHSAMSWDRNREAKQYLQEAGWAFTAGLYNHACSAVESAWALGLKTIETEELRIRSYSCVAYPDPSSERPPFLTEYTAGSIKIDSYRDHLSAATMSLELLAASVATSSEGNAGHLQGIGTKALYNASRVLRAAYENQLIKGNEAALEHLRLLAREAYASLKTPNSYVHQLKAAYLPFWYDTTEQMLAEYTSLLHLETDAEMKDLIMFSMTEGRDFPFLIDWSLPPEDTQLKIPWGTFVERLYASPSLYDQCCAYALDLNTVPPRRRIDRLQKLDELEAFILKNRDALFLASEPEDFQMIVDRLVKYHGSHLTRDLCAELISSAMSEQRPLPAAFDGLFITWILEYKDNKQDTQMFYDLLTSMEGIGGDEADVARRDAPRSLKDLMEQLVPGIRSSESTGSDEFIVGDFWHPCGKPGLSLWPKFSIIQAHADDDNVLVYGYPKRSDQVSPVLQVSPDGAVQQIGEMPFSSHELDTLQFMNDGRFVMFSPGMLRCGDSVDHRQWREYEIPNKAYSDVVVSSNRLFLAFSHIDNSELNQGSNDFRNSGMIELDLTTGERWVRASSLRRPAESPLDDCNPYIIERLWMPSPDRVVMRCNMHPQGATAESSPVKHYVYDRTVGLITPLDLPPDEAGGKVFFVENTMNVIDSEGWYVLNVSDPPKKEFIAGPGTVNPLPQDFARKGFTVYFVGRYVFFLFQRTSETSGRITFQIFDRETAQWCEIPIRLSLSEEDRQLLTKNGYRVFSMAEDPNDIVWTVGNGRDLVGQTTDTDLILPYWYKPGFWHVPKSRLLSTAQRLFEAKTKTTATTLE